MSMDYWGVKMYGVSDNDICAKDYNLFGIQAEIDESFVNVDVNGKTVTLDFELAEDTAWLGFAPVYPWDATAEDLKISRQDVVDAIVKFLTPYGYNEEEIRENCDYINTYNCG